MFLRTLQLPTVTTVPVTVTPTGSLQTPTANLQTPSVALQQLLDIGHKPRNPSSTVSLAAAPMVERRASASLPACFIVTRVVEQALRPFFLQTAVECLLLCVGDSVLAGASNDRDLHAFPSSSSRTAEQKCQRSRSHSSSADTLLRHLRPSMDESTFSLAAHLHCFNSVVDQIDNAPPHAEDPC